MSDKIELSKGEWKATINGRHLSFDGPCVDDGGYGVDIDDPKDLDYLIELLAEVKAKFGVNHED